MMSGRLAHRRDVVGRYAIDADCDGVADVWNPADAIAVRRGSVRTVLPRTTAVSSSRTTAPAGTCADSFARADHCDHTHVG
jgi:hypothetical protein